MTRSVQPLNYITSAARWFANRGSDADQVLHKVLRIATERQALTEDPHQALDAQQTFGGRLADRVATFGGSWTFITLFGLVLAAWTLLNTEILGPTAFDPYPYIFLNLMLSMLAAIQAPIILMSQNRQAIKDRQMASYDYEVNLKAEVEIMALHEKMDLLRSEHLAALLEQQQRHFEQLAQLIGSMNKPTAPTCTPTPDHPSGP